MSCNCDVLHRHPCADSDKIPKDGTSTYILHISELVLHGMLGSLSGKKGSGEAAKASHTAQHTSELHSCDEK